MKAFLTFAAACFMAAAPGLRAQSLAPEDQYFDIYSLIVKGNRQEEKGRWQAAQTNYLDAARELKKFQEDFPLWNKNVVKYRLGYLETKLSAPATNAPRASSAPVELKMKWQVGKRYEQQMAMTTDNNINVPGQGQPMQQKIKMGMGYAISVVKQQDDGGRELDLQLTGMSMNMDMGGTTLMSFDSKKPDSMAGSPAAPMLQKMSDLHIKMFTDKAGKVQKVEGLEELVNGSNGQDANPGMDTLKGILSDDSIKQLAAPEGLPNHPVKVGESWPAKNEMAIPGMGTMVSDMTYTFTGWEQRDNHKCAVLSFTGSMYTKPDDAGANAMVSIDSGSGSGELYFDPALGMPVETSTVQNLNMKVNVQGQSISTKVVQDVSTKLASVTDISQ